MRGWDFGFRVLGVGFLVWGLRFQISRFGFGVQHFGLRGMGYHVGREDAEEGRRLASQV